MNFRNVNSRILISFTTKIKYHCIMLDTGVLDATILSISQPDVFELSNDMLVLLDNLTYSRYAKHFKPNR